MNTSLKKSGEYVIKKRWLRIKTGLRSVHMIWPLPGPKGINKYGLCKCSMLDKRDPWLSSDTGNVWRSSVNKAMLTGTCPWPS